MKGFLAHHPCKRASQRACEQEIRKFEKRVFSVKTTGFDQFLDRNRLPSSNRVAHLPHGPGRDAFSTGVQAVEVRRDPAAIFRDRAFRKGVDLARAR
jgi:hypothetical protein